MAAKARRLLAVATALAIAVAGSGMPAVAAPVEMRVSHQWQQGTDARDRALRVFVDAVSRRVADVKFRIHPSLSLNIKAVAQYDALQSGTLEMSIYPLVYAAGKVPEFSITILPGAVSSLDEAVRLRNSAFHKKLQEIAHRNGVHILTWWWTPGGFVSRSKPIGHPDSVKGLAMRAADPVYESMLKSAGASIRSMPSSELYPALHSGALDALLTSTESLVSMRLYDQVKEATIGGDYTMFMLLQPLLVSTKSWEALTPEQKAAFEEAARVSESFFEGTQRQSVDKAVEAYSKAGVNVRPLTKGDYEAWIALARKTAWPEYESKSADARDLLKLLLAGLGK